MIKIVNMDKFYYGQNVSVQALKDINLTIQPNEFIAIMGPSGSGKSTLINIIGCLDSCTSGKYYLDGLDVSAISNSQLAKIRNKKVGFIFQNFSLLPRLTVLENVETPLLYAGTKKEIRHNSALNVLNKLELLDRIHHYPNELSGGQKQRVAIARALISQPSVILADEPTGSLDRRMGEEILNIFTMLHTEGATIIMVTHEHSVAKYAKRIINFQDGQIINTNDWKANS